MTKEMDMQALERAFSLLGRLLAREGKGPYRLAVCGGAAMIGGNLVARVTRDVDVVALMDSAVQLVSPDPLPTELLEVAERVRLEYDLPEGWLNNGPSREPGGLFQQGLPEGFSDRLSRRDYGSNLTVYFASRLDLIHFKVFAAVDQGYGRHVDDLAEMKPTAEEMAAAARWTLIHDPSPGFRVMLVSMLKQLGFSDVAEGLQ